MRSATSQGVELSLTQQPNETGKILLSPSKDPANKAGANLKNMVVALSNQAAGIGPIIAPLQERFAGGFVFSQNLLSPPGNWTVNITAQRPGAYDAAASFSLDYPREITESDAHAEDRTFGSFEITLIVIALCILAASIPLYRKSAALNRLTLSAPKEAPSIATLSFAHRRAWIPPLLLIAIVLYITGGLPALSRGVLESSFERGLRKRERDLRLARKRSRTRRLKGTSDLAPPVLHNRDRALASSTSPTPASSITLTGQRRPDSQLATESCGSWPRMFLPSLHLLCMITRGIPSGIWSWTTIAFFTW